MNTSIELHDTFVRSATRNGDGSGDIRLWAVIHRFEGELGSGFHDSGWQNVCLRFRDMVIDGETGNGDDYISHGFLSVNGRTENDLIAFPIEQQGDLLLSIVMSVTDDFPAVTIRGSGLSIFAESDFKLEHVWDAEGNYRDQELSE